MRRNAGMVIRSLRHVQDVPQRLKIREVEASTLLDRIAKIEGSARDDVVNVPFPRSVPVVRPDHPGRELAFEMRPQLRDRAADQVERPARLQPVASANRLVDAAAQVAAEPIVLTRLAEPFF